MGSLIAALNDQNISAANAETLEDVYTANPANAGYTDNPFGYNASPAVIQTAYPKYGYNATAPQTPQSYEDYDLTSLFGMLQDMKKPQPVYDDRLYPADPFSGTARTQGDAGVDRPSLSEYPPLQPGHPLYHPPYNPNPQPVTPGGKLGQMPVPTTTPQPVTPGGILAEAAKVQQSKQPVQPAGPPVTGGYTVPGAPTAPADTTAEDQAAAQAAEDARIQKMFAEQIAANELANAQRIYNTTRRDTAGPQTTFTSAAAARAGTQKIKEDWANLIDSGGM